jgi:hypothetical protein
MRLGQSTLDATERLAEARRLLALISGANAAHERMPMKDLDFIQSMTDLIADRGDNTPVSPNQLFYLRDIWERC